MKISWGHGELLLLWASKKKIGVFQPTNLILKKAG
jgi:hypothetical protein